MYHPGMRRGKVNIRLLVLLAVLIVPAALIATVAARTALVDARQVGDAYEINLKKLSSFPLHQTAGTIRDVPAKWREFDGKKVILKGQMWAPNRVAGRVRDFDLVYSITECCYVGEPQIQHFVKASVPEGVEVDYAGSDRVRVVGTLRVDVTRNGGGDRIDGVYHLDVDEVTAL